ncbi:hypothetical protein LCGC14_2712530 [marine sediment metagenome]|uniref:Uncharacterized protein n=1 Tax=marine sediment metagenome TaxID=412755 RepID=A0A0F8ZCH1_9ZZZZ
MSTYMIAAMICVGLAAVGLGTYTLTVSLVSMYWKAVWQHYVMVTIGLLVFIIGLIIVAIPVIELIL